MLYFQQKPCFLDLIKFDFLLVVICLLDQSLGLHNRIIGDQTLTYRRSLIICKSQGKGPDADNWPFSSQKKALRWTACDEISVLATLIVQVAPLVIFLDKRGLNAFLKPFMLVFNKWGTYARPPRLLRVPTRSSTTKRRSKKTQSDMRKTHRLAPTRFFATGKLAPKKGKKRLVLVRI